jgi:hypothetical protein
MALTDSQIRSALPADSRYRLSDGEHGLYLCIHPHGGKYFVFRFTWRGKDAELALGAYPQENPKASAHSRRQRRAVGRRGSRSSGGTACGESPQAPYLSRSSRGVVRYPYQTLWQGSDPPEAAPGSKDDLQDSLDFRRPPLPFCWTVVPIHELLSAGALSTERIARLDDADLNRLMTD